jgi:mRNA-degrading endonuclease RelE of RelBE toxin-antitoxin system
MARRIQWSNAAKADLRLIPVFRRRPISTAVGLLVDQSKIETQNRKPLALPMEDLPNGTWEARVGDHRIFYWHEDDETVTILRVILKGTSRTADAIARGRKP